MGLLLVAVAAIGLSAIIVVAWGWKFLLAPLIGALVWAWGTATLRSFRRGAHGVGSPGDADDGPTDVPGRTLYWCEECNAELLVVAAGTGLPPRHCGARMHRRQEV